jgi:Uma2 family endonuclease
MSIAHKYQLTEQDYLTSELTRAVKHEFVHGEVLAMVGAGSAHNLIAGHVHTALNLHLKGKPCRPYVESMKVRIAGSYYYPDVLVDCSDIADDAYFAETPILIVEVLSESTKSYDKTFKLQQYKKYPLYKSM